MPGSLIQIQSTPAPLATLSEIHSLSADSGVALHLRATLTESHTLTATGSVLGTLSATLSETHTLTATGRLNDEANVFGETTLSETHTLTAAGRLAINAVAHLSEAHTLTANGHVTVAETFGFTYFVDILDSAFVPSGYYRYYTARLIVDGDEVPITDFQFNAPKGSLASTLSVTLARPIPSQVTRTSSITFDIGTRASALVPISWQNYIYFGGLDSRGYSISWRPGNAAGPGDKVVFSAVNPLADAFRLAPRVPVTLYDPARVTIDEQVDTSNAIHDENGAAILPVNETVEGLSLYNVLERVYVDECGFAAYRTNIPDYPVSRADFSIEAGWHAGVAPLVGMFEPLYYTTATGELFIVDKSSALPAGLVPQTITTSNYSSLSENLSAGALVDGLIVIVSSTGGDYSTERVEYDPPSTTFNYGEPGFTSSITSRRIREWRNTSAPAVIVREQLLNTTITTTNAWSELIGREIQTDVFDALGRKASHTRTVEAMVPDLSDGGTLALTTITSETCSISYRPDPAQPSRSLQDRVTTQVRGLIHIDNANTYLGQPFKAPYMKVHQSGGIDAEADQSSEFGPIETKEERLEVTGQGQTTVKVRTIDHIRGTVTPGASTPRVGETSLGTRASSQRRVLLTIAGFESSGQRVESFSTGEVPDAIAIPLGRRRLARLNAPPNGLNLELPDVDFALRRGSTRRALDRSGAVVADVICESYSISGSRLGSPEQEIRMSIQAEETVAD